ncbi:hypothetical protein BDN72DRAFT_904727 [Pluteus cervinus]|uniref:Uncharacterized protein n=1 Tax=Pluteus cervinus TaxID=181527 RepID=A0ACD3A7C0_9AGAR|nr:hypothetical protein BDN72DRAFT_904727 [Pluteus cervinus]
MPTTEISLLPISLATSLTTNFDVNQEGWKILSDRSPHLREIEVSRLAIPPFLLALGAGDIDDLDPNEEWRGLAGYLGGMEAVASGVGHPEYDTIERDVGSHPLFTSLTSIYLNGMPQVHIVKEDVVNALSVRCIKGLPIETIRLSNWSGDDELLFDLKGLVRVVDYTNPNQGWDSY